MIRIIQNGNETLARVDGTIAIGLEVAVQITTSDGEVMVLMLDVSTAITLESDLCSANAKVVRNMDRISK